MAFTGTPVVVQITKRLWRITGVSLAADASGTIGFSDKTSPAEVSLEAPDWQPYHLPDGQPVTLVQAVKVSTVPTTDVTAAVPISIVKTGATHHNFVATLHNDTAGTVSAQLEIYAEWAGH